MKKTAIILLALIVGLCLAHGAFAEDYMVILIGVNSGNVVDVYASDQVGAPGTGKNKGKIILICDKATPHLKADGTPSTLPPPSVIIEKTLVTKFAASSPGCRYIWHPAGYYIKVCN